MAVGDRYNLHIANLQRSLKKATAYMVWFEKWPVAGCAEMPRCQAPRGEGKHSPTAQAMDWSKWNKEKPDGITKHDALSTFVSTFQDTLALFVAL